MLKSLLMGAVVITTMTFGTFAQADTIDIDDDGTVVTERSTYIERRAVIEDGDEDGPRVYGWASDRPADCGAYRYWDGEDCVDARSVPPDTGPKW